EECKTGPAAYTPKTQAVPAKPVRGLWILLAAIGVVGTYAAQILPRLAGQAPAPNGFLGCAVLTGLLFFLICKRFDRSPFVGATIGVVMGLGVAIATGSGLRFTMPAAQPEPRTSSRPEAPANSRPEAPANSRLEAKVLEAVRDYDPVVAAEI